MGQPTRQYDFARAAAVLLFKTNYDKPAIRFIAYSIGWELTDESYIGPDPAGILHYDDDIFDIVVKDSTKAKFRVEQFFENGERYLRIKFFKPGSDSNYFGEFIAKDIHNRAGTSGILNQTREATWKRQDYITLPVTISKSGSSTEITIAGQKSAKINSGKDLAGYSINNIRANLTTKNLNDLGKYVRWHKDRAVFHKDDYPHTRDFNSFLFPDNEKKTISSADGFAFWVTWK